MRLPPSFPDIEEHFTMVLHPENAIFEKPKWQSPIVDQTTEWRIGGQQSQGECQEKALFERLGIFQHPTRNIAFDSEARAPAVDQFTCLEQREIAVIVGGRRAIVKEPGRRNRDYHFFSPK